jgi:hypothetical protein
MLSITSTKTSLDFKTVKRYKKKTIHISLKICDVIPKQNTEKKNSIMIKIDKCHTLS